MQIVNVPFPDCISFGARSEPMWMTEIVQTIGGQEIANQNWAHARHQFDVSLAIRTTTDYGLVRTHFHAVRGRAKGFLFRDPLDYTVTAAASYVDDSPTTAGTFRLFKRYGSGPDAYDRRITRPLAGLQIFRTRSATTTNVTANATLDLATGTFTVTGDQTDDAYTWSGSFSVPCRYDVDRLPTAIVNKEPTGELLVSCDAIPIIEIRDGQ